MAINWNIPNPTIYFKHNRTWSPVWVLVTGSRFMFRVLGCSWPSSWPKFHGFSKGPTHCKACQSHASSNRDMLEVFWISMEQDVTVTLQCRLHRILSYYLGRQNKWKRVPRCRVIKWSSVGKFLKKNAGAWRTTFQGSQHPSDLQLNRISRWPIFSFELLSLRNKRNTWGILWLWPLLSSGAISSWPWHCRLLCQ